jgi:hypothetical protein
MYLVYKNLFPSCIVPNQTVVLFPKLNFVFLFDFAKSQVEWNIRQSVEYVCNDTVYMCSYPTLQVSRWDDMRSWSLSLQVHICEYDNLHDILHRRRTEG